MASVKFGHELRVNGSRGARAALQALPGESDGVVSSVREFNDGRSQRGQGAAMALAAGRQEQSACLVPKSFPYM
jgi:hypothetical protein